jgi:hypothetical protein
VEFVCGEALAYFSTDRAAVDSFAINGALYAAKVASGYTRLLFEGQRVCAILLVRLTLPHVASEAV